MMGLTVYLKLVSGEEVVATLLSSPPVTDYYVFEDMYVVKNVAAADGLGYFLMKYLYHCKDRKFAIRPIHVISGPTNPTKEIEEEYQKVRETANCRSDFDNEETIH